LEADVQKVYWNISEIPAAIEKCFIDVKSNFLQRFNVSWVEHNKNNDWIRYQQATRSFDELYQQLLNL
jgi:hypothetical protein